jgi:Flp pilus assembly protein TadG
MDAVRRWHRRDEEADDAGAVSVFVITLALMLLMLGGLVFDGGSAMNARAKASDDAEQAARAGAEQLDQAALRSSGQVEIDPAAASRAAHDYLAGLGYPDASIGPPQVVGDTVSVTITTTYATKMLNMIDIKSFPIRASATARAAVGITAEEPAP